MNNTTPRTFAADSADSRLLTAYFNDLSAEANLMTPEEEITCIKRFREGSMQDREKLIVANLRFVVQIAKEYQHNGLPLADLISEGNMGLIHGIDRFDPARGVRLITYAVWWIRQAILAALSEQVRLIRLPKHVVQQINKLCKVVDVVHEYAGTQTTCNIASMLDIAPDSVDALLVIAQQPISLNDSLQEDDPATVLDVYTDPEADDPDARMLAIDLREKVDALLRSLPEREAYVLRRYFGIYPFASESAFSAIGKQLGVSKERVRQMRNEALTRLRAPKHRRLMALYAE